MSMDIIELVKKIHFDDKKYKNDNLSLDEAYQKCIKENSEFPIISSHKVFLERLETFIDENTRKTIIDSLSTDPGLFKSVINLFNDLNEKMSLDIDNDDNVLYKQSHNYYEKLKTEGVVKIPNVFSDAQLEKLLQFVGYVEHVLGTNLEHSGFISMPIGYDQITKQYYFAQPRHTKVTPNYGNSRLGSKSWKLGAQNIYHPGSESIIENKLIQNINKLWYKNNDIKPWRMTLDWVYPAPYNHNTWHLDKIRKVTKAFVLLDDVTLSNGPTYYAKGSHKINNNLELDVKHAIFVNEGKDMCIRDGKRYGNNLAAHKGIHAGSLPDNLADNNSREVTEGKVQLAEIEYEKVLATGKKGDVFLMDTCGFHRGNFVHESVRRTIYLTFDHDATFLGKFLDNLGKSKF